MSAKQDRQGARTATDLERKYNFGKTFAELLGLITDARDSVDAASSSLRGEFENQVTSLRRDTERIIMEALKEYVLETELEEVRKEFSSQFEQTAESITMRFNATTEEIAKVSGDLQSVGESLEEMRSNFTSEFEQTAERISANFTATTNEISRVSGDLQGVSDALEETRQEVASNFEQTAKHISTNFRSTTEEIARVSNDVQGVSEELEQTRRDVASNYEQTAKHIFATFTSTMNKIEDVDGSLQGIAETLEKHFEFTVDGLTIKAGSGSMSLQLNNDIIRFYKNGQEFGRWDGTNFHTGNIYIAAEERAQFGNFAFTPRSNGSMDFGKVGG